MSIAHAILGSMLLVSPALAVLPVEGFFPTYYVVRDNAADVCEVTTAKPRGRGQTIMGDLHFKRKVDAERAAREHCHRYKEGQTRVA